mgnify:CR=1 FL=1
MKVLFMYDHCAVGKVKRGEPRRDSERSDKADSVTEDILEKYRGTSAKPPVSSSGASGMCIYFCRSYPSGREFSLEFSLPHPHT